MCPFLFQHLGNERLTVILLKIFEKGFDNLSSNTFLNQLEYQGGILKFCLVHVFSTQHQQGCTTVISWSGTEGLGILHERGGRACTIAVRCLFSELAVVSVGTSRLKSTFLTVLPLIFLTVLYHCFHRALKNSLTLLCGNTQMKLSESFL